MCIRDSINAEYMGASWLNAVPRGEQKGKSGRQPPQGGVQRIAVAVGAEAADHADRLVAEVAGMAERLAAVRVGQVDFDEGQGHCRQRVADRDGGVGEGGRIDQDEGGAVGAGGLDTVHQRVLGIGLTGAQLMAGFLRLRHQCQVDVCQRRMAIDLRLARAEQVEVGAMQDQQLRHSALQRKGGSLLEAADAVQLAEVRLVSSNCLIFLSGHARSWAYDRHRRDR
eukprot:TRINITY_DN19018_c0_g1_i1.p2 TRINITY_DN19018_c0_g1~~TRINITY_DN19018_c0_g1_i1.p2  ORF type:complete len:225 (+),score=29.08 TRINITY_DN19018_c0_g1_i1:189-863(+)